MGIRAALLTNLALWVAWAVYWLIAARGAKRTQWREPLRRHWLHTGLALLGTLILTLPRLTPPLLHERFLGDPLLFAIIGTVVTAVGHGIAIAARVQLAGNWSAAVAIKQDHALIRRGLYRYARHPIYSGILLALLGSAIAVGQWRDLIGFALILISLLLKLRHEEERLRATFADYASYAARTAALVPFLF